MHVIVWIRVFQMYLYTEDIGYITICYEDHSTVFHFMGLKPCLSEQQTLTYDVAIISSNRYDILIPSL